MSAGDVGEFRRKLGGLSAAYRTSLPATVAALRSEWQRLAAGDADPKVAHELRRSVHSIAGSAGSFGLQQVSACALELERFLDELPGPAGLPRPQDAEEFQRLLAALEGAVAAAA